MSVFVAETNLNPWPTIKLKSKQVRIQKIQNSNCFPQRHWYKLSHTHKPQKNEKCTPPMSSNPQLFAVLANQRAAVTAGAQPIRRQERRRLRPHSLLLYVSVSDHPFIFASPHTSLCPCILLLSALRLLETCRLDSLFSSLKTFSFISHHVVELVTSLRLPVSFSQPCLYFLSRLLSQDMPVVVWTH